MRSLLKDQAKFEILNIKKDWLTFTLNHEKCVKKYYKNL